MDLQVCRRCSTALAVLLAGLMVGPSSAQTGASREMVSFASDTAFDGGMTVRGELRIPASGKDRVPAVLMLHSSNGIDGTGAFYAEALSQAGIATLEIDMFPSGGRPRTTRVNMPAAYGSLLFLAKHPRIDPNRIGVIGFSWGGIMTIVTASEEVTQQYTGGKARFAAHLALYPVCWAHLAMIAGQNQFFGPETFRRFTGAPLHILAGEKDDYDDPDSCPKFVEALPDEARRHVAATVYPGAYHAWDNPGGGGATYYDPGAYKGRGGNVRRGTNRDLATKSRQFAVQFFAKSLSSN